MEDPAGIQIVIEDSGLFLIAPAHGLQAAQAQQPLEDLAADIDAVGRAEENLAYQRSELKRLIAEALIDRENSRMESRKMAKKVEADRLAARLTIRQYEEGLATSIDVQTATVTLLQSQAQQLQSRLTFLYKT